jgi:hypothetical protein
MPVSLKGVLPDRAVQTITNLQQQVADQKTQLDALDKSKLDQTQADAKYGPAATRAALQVGGTHPLNTMGLLGTLSPVPAGTYVTGLKLTGGGNNGSITLDATGRVIAIVPAS